MLSPEERRTREAVGLMGKDATKQRLSTLPLASEPYATQTPARFFKSCEALRIWIFSAID